MTFTYQGRDYQLFDDKYNATVTNERAVEIPIARTFVASSNGEGLELGNVLSHYGCETPRRIVDRYEVASGVENLDVFEIGGQYDWIVSISTIEHVRWHPGTNQHNPWGAVAALAYLRGLLRPDGRMLVTVGIGQNPVLDEFLVETDEPFEVFGANEATSILRTRTDDPAVNEWREDWPTPEMREYGPTHGANAVWIGEW